MLKLITTPVCCVSSVCGVGCVGACVSCACAQACGRPWDVVTVTFGLGLVVVFGGGFGSANGSDVDQVCSGHGEAELAGWV